MPTFGGRLKHAWNAFLGRDAPWGNPQLYSGSSTNPQHNRLHFGAERSIVNAIYTRIAIDVASTSIRHVRLDENGRYMEDIYDGLNECLTVEANKDQTGRAFIQDIVVSMFDEGVVAVVPIDTSVDPRSSNSYEIHSMRTGKIHEWLPDYVRVELYNDRTGKKEEIAVPKKMCAIIENPFYSVMNEPNSTMQRLIRKLALMDSIDEQTANGKIDLIIQLPYILKSPAKKAEADRRRLEIEQQLEGSKYGIAYTDGTERVTQLNRSLENNLVKQVEYLTEQLFNQLGLTMEVFNGTANEATMLNYNNRTIEPILSAITDEFFRKFLTKTARTQGQSIKFFKEPFKLTPVANLAEIADKFTRNEIMSSNEIRSIVGMKPSDDPAADELRNKNLNQSDEQLQANMNDPMSQVQDAQDMNSGAVNDNVADVPISELINHSDQNGSKL